jgi:hypothetical protein
MTGASDASSRAVPDLGFLGGHAAGLTGGDPGVLLGAPGSGAAVLPVRHRPAYVADDIIITEGVHTFFIPGAQVAAMGQQTTRPESVHEVKMRMLISWPFDESSLIVGEETYSAVIAVRPLADAELPAELPAVLIG